MKTKLLTVCFLSAGVVMAHGQGIAPPNAFRLQMQRVWEVILPEQVKLFDVGKVSSDRENRLIVMTGGLNKDDYKRKMMVLRWNGQQFIPEHTAEFLGSSVDTLIAAPFRVSNAKPVKGQKLVPSAPQQILTSEGFYTWTGNGYSRAFSAPRDIRAAIIPEKTAALIIVGTGDSAAVREATETDIRPSEWEPPNDGAGYVEYATGTQEPLPVFTLGARSAQSYWQNRVKWIIGLVPGDPANQPDAPNATVRDRMVVLAPKVSARDKSFWATKPDDFEEVWRSEPLPGRVLDVRIGDPKNEGRDSVLVLTAESNDKVRRLHCFTVTQGILIGR
jgi:hypothetical protein